MGWSSKVSTSFQPRNPPGCFHHPRIDWSSTPGADSPFCDETKKQKRMNFHMLKKKGWMNGWTKKNVTKNIKNSTPASFRWTLGGSDTWVLFVYCVCMRVSSQFLATLFCESTLLWFAYTPDFGEEVLIQNHFLWCLFQLHGSFFSEKTSPKLE